jgi:hypothetical protein
MVKGVRSDIPNLYRCESLADLKRVMALPEKDLPKEAQRTDQEWTDGKWEFFKDAAGRGYRNLKTGRIVRPKPKKKKKVAT